MTYLPFLKSNFSILNKSGFSLISNTKSIGINKEYLTDRDCLIYNGKKDLFLAIFKYYASLSDFTNLSFIHMSSFIRFLKDTYIIHPNKENKDNEIDNNRSKDQTNRSQTYRSFSSSNFNFSSSNIGSSKLIKSIKQTNEIKAIKFDSISPIKTKINNHTNNQDNSNSINSPRSPRSQNSLNYSHVSAAEHKQSNPIKINIKKLNLGQSRSFNNKTSMSPTYRTGTAGSPRFYSARKRLKLHEINLLFSKFSTEAANFDGTSSKSITSKPNNSNKKISFTTFMKFIYYFSSMLY